MKTISSKDIVKLLLFIFILFSQKLFSQCPTPPGNQNSYGSGSWIGYVYSAVNTSNPPSNAFTTTYRGYVTQSEIFDLDLGGGAISGANLCGTYSDQFSIRFKMTKNFPAGNYSFIVGGDDGYRLSVNGNYIINNFVDHSYTTTTTTSTVYLSGNVNLVLEYYEQTGSSRISFSYANCANPSTAPTGISGTNSICSGSSTTLTATGGTLATGAVYQWGTGTVGNNIINGQTAVSITVSPTTTTTYWVRRVDQDPCAANTNGVTQAVTVTTASTAPTSITGTTTICLGNSTTLTASGGTLGSNGTYEWGTGYTAGINTIPGATSATLTVSPTATTGYWVRRVDTAGCANATGIIATTVNVNTPVGDQVSYGNATWIGYVYSGLNTDNPPSNIGTAPYRGYITQPEIFDQDIVTNALSGGNLCGTYADQFFIRYKMTKNFTEGYYTFTVGGDDGYRLSLDGGASYLINNFVDHSYATSTSATVYLNGNTNLILEYYEQGTNSRVSFTYTSCTNFSTAPTGISGNLNLCSTAGGTSLTATGGNAAPGCTYQWGTGSIVGTNPIAGATYNGYYINPATTTTYWVRRVDGSPCNQSSAGYVFTVNVATRSSQPATITPSAATVCSGNTVTITAAGGTMGTNAVYEWGTGYNAGANTIAGQSGATITLNPTATSGYWVRRVDSAPCNYSTGHITTTITVINPSTAPTSISGGNTTACSGNSYTLTATGGTAASGSTYQWGTGSVVGTNPITGNGVSITVSPTSTTTYWVRRYDASCSAYTDGVTTTITISAPPGTPSVAGNNVWNLYGYSTADISLATTVYAGYYSVSTLNFDTQNGTNSWTSTASPSSAAGWNGCTVPADNFTMVAKRKGFPCGTYTIAMQNWDDDIQFYLNGTMIWSNANWSGGNVNTVIGSYALDTNSEIEVRVREIGGNANLSFTLTNTFVASTAPDTISGTTAICSGSSTTLTASGGTHGTTATYEWGTGTVLGSNPISGTTASITVSPTSDTTYWVRRKETGCGGNITTGVTRSVTVSAPTVAGSLSTSATTICRNTAPGSIVLTGNTGNVVKWQYATNAAFTSGVTDIASTATTLSSATIGTLTATRYFRAVVQNTPCATANTAVIGIIVPASVTYSNGSWSGTPTSTTPAVISSNLTLSSNLNVCSCQVTNSAVLTVPANVTLIVQNDLSVASTGNIVIQDKGSLVQVNNTATNSGNITYKRNTTPLKEYDYTYWSSPLANQALSRLGTPSLFYSFSPAINNWSYEYATTTMAAAKGYIARAPDNLSYATPQTVAVSFVGTPNNGIINVPIVKSTGTFSLIGNPYPSAIDIDAFLLDAANSGVINGTIYLWTHNTAISNTIAGTGIYNYTRDDYAKYNITGGVKTASTAATGGAEPTGKIASGQAFFIEANSSLANGNYTATFNNSMRVVNNNNQFFRINPANVNEPVAGGTSFIQKNRVWLNITNAQGAYDEALVGYITGATNGFDNLFDGKTFPAGNVVSIYSILESNNYSIQGRALPFNDTDVIPLGISTSIDGEFSIDLERFDGLFANQNVYLFDKTTHQYHDLKSGAYPFTITNGTYNDRFELHFRNGTLGVNQPIAPDNNIKIIKINKHIEVLADNAAIKTVQLFDLSGRALYHAKSINSNEFKTADLNVGTQVIIVKATLDNGQIISKKVIMNN